MAIALNPDVTVFSSVTEEQGVTTAAGVSTWNSVVGGAEPEYLYLMSGGVLLLMSGGGLLLMSNNNV
jgi:hypothetical protein